MNIENEIKKNYKVFLKQNKSNGMYPCAAMEDAMKRSVNELQKKMGIKIHTKDGKFQITPRQNPKEN